MADACCATRYPHKFRLVKNCLIILKINGLPEVQSIYKGGLGFTEHNRTAKEPTKPKQKIIHKLAQLHFFGRSLRLLKSTKTRLIEAILINLFAQT